MVNFLILVYFIIHEERNPCIFCILPGISCSLKVDDISCVLPSISFEHVLHFGGYHLFPEKNNSSLWLIFLACI